MAKKRTCRKYRVHVAGVQFGGSVAVMAKSYPAAEGHARRVAARLTESETRDWVHRRRGKAYHARGC